MEKTAAVLYSGGKDSTYAIDRLRRLGYCISCLVTVFSENPDSYMLHTANIRLTELSAKALEIPIVFGRTRGNKEDELEDIKRTIMTARESYSFEALGSGGLASSYQKSRIEKIANECNLIPENPLWGFNQEAYVKELADAGFRFILTSVSAAGLDESWLGREIDRNSAQELVRLSRKYKFNPALEGGEGETLVLDCPLFKRNRLKVLESRKKWNGYQGVLEIIKLVLEPKSNQVS